MPSDDSPQVAADTLSVLAADAGARSPRRWRRRAAGPGAPGRVRTRRTRRAGPTHRARSGARPRTRSAAAGRRTWSGPRSRCRRPRRTWAAALRPAGRRSATRSGAPGRRRAWRPPIRSALLSRPVPSPCSAQRPTAAPDRFTETDCPDEPAEDQPGSDRRIDAGQRLGERGQAGARPRPAGDGTEQAARPAGSPRIGHRGSAPTTTSRTASRSRGFTARSSHRHGRPAADVGRQPGAAPNVRRRPPRSARRHRCVSLMV